jgi:hypothetical protein
MKRGKTLSAVDLVFAPILFVLGFVVVEGHNLLSAWWPDGRKRKLAKDGFPKEFKVQRVGVTAIKAISGLPPSEIVSYFRDYPETARALLGESYDKRYTPSTFISENGDGSFRVGWLTRGAQYECVRNFEDLADAATDYLLFSLGKSRWTPTK